MCHTMIFARAVSALLVLSILGVMGFGGDTCPQSGTFGGSGPMSCTGTCSTGDCKPRRRALPPNPPEHASYATSCMCEDEGQGGVVGGCCHIVVILVNPPGPGWSYTAVTEGTCPACSAPGSCTLGGTGTASDPWQPVCDGNPIGS